MHIPSLRIQQICLGKSTQEAVKTPAEVGHLASMRDCETYRTRMLQSIPPSIWPEGSVTSYSHPMLVSAGNHINQIKDLQEALTAAIVSIVERWWEPKANFPSRMPLEPYEEDLLIWMAKLPMGMIPPFHQCLGSWRPDFLIENVPNHSNPYESCVRFRICEINARFCWNGFLHTAYGQQAFHDMGAGENGFQGAAHCEEVSLTESILSSLPANILTGIFSLFDTSKTLHFLKGKEEGIDIGMLAWLVEQRTGISPRFIRPEDLRLVPSMRGHLGQTLCCVISDDAKAPTTSSIFHSNGERLEEIHQVNIELHQSELRAMPTDILRHLSLRCFNDMRTIFLVHDKRMLGLVLQELDSLVYQQKVLTPAQAEILREGISPTFLPGSAELNQLITISRIFPNIRNRFILKPIRSGKGAGILFGDELSPEDWQEKIQGCRCPVISPNSTSYIVQRSIPQPVYDVVSGENCKSKPARLVGTYFVINGRYCGLGLWRASRARICAVSQGASWMCSVFQNSKEIEQSFI
ncbi:hypothetical protein N7466_007774 [Penicillium verhagenii]|uniref:uncharacterized protein n=1 Tax=Penicillium verhagenii TaxID=1562060 RepID=UPI002545180D|nr:uncharacterized protein N7466_007774 [Penicillium verhagenii]KAJ5928818.1 hypothetical protein N7466_007774 [Penicillium verhagenii]